MLPGEKDSIGDESRQEVLTVKTTWSVTRPLAPVAAWAPVSATPSSFPAPAGVRACVALPVAVAGPVPADAPQHPQAHQVRVQAELALTAVRARGSYGINGFTVKGMSAGATKRLIDGARGVPPRGRPV
jgi:hypothetical protein